MISVMSSDDINSHDIDQTRIGRSLMAMANLEL